MTDRDRIEWLTSELSLVLGIALGCASKHGDEEAMRMLLAGEFAGELAKNEPDRLIGQMMRKYGPRA